MTGNINLFIEDYEQDYYYECLRNIEDYILLILIIASKLVNCKKKDNASLKSIINSDKSFLSVVINKTSRAYIFLGRCKYYSISLPLDLCFSNNKVEQCCSVYLQGTEIKFDNNNIVACKEIINTYKGNSTNIFKDICFDYWDGNVSEDIFNILTRLYQEEPGYLRYDHDYQADKKNSFKHPLNHLDVNMSQQATYKIGLFNQLSYEQFIDILNPKTDCYFLSKNNKITEEHRILNMKKNKRKK